MTREEILAGLNDFFALVCTIYGEARGEPLEGQVAVGCVIRNRVLSPYRWATSYRGVCLEPLQFSCWSPAGGEENHAATLAYAERMLGDFAEERFDPVPIADVERQLRWIADGIIGGHIADRVYGANHYLASWLIGSGHAPTWARTSPHSSALRSPVDEIGGHSFFKIG